MRNKIEKTFLYNGFGFPVLLVNVPMIEVMGVRTPDINYNKLQKTLLFFLAKDSVLFTGNEIKFIRKHFEMSMEEFAKFFGVTHAAISKWEAKGNQPINTDKTTEICIRLFIFDRLLGEKDSKFREIFREISSKELALNPPKFKPISYDAEKEELIAV
jgi:transcriptional regulator with XRE-family HTH domain